MAASPENPASATSASTSGPAKGQAAAVAGQTPPLRQVLSSAWQVPLLVVGLGILIAGISTVWMSRPKADPGSPLAEARELLEAGKFEESIGVLNERVRPFLETGRAAPGQQIEFYLIRARAFAGAQTALSINRAENHRVVVSDLLRAEKLGQDLEPADVTRLAESQLALGEVERALERMRSLPQSELARRTRLTRSIVTWNLSRPHPDDELTIELLGWLMSVPDLPPDDRVWVLSRQTEALLASGRYEDAIAKLSREILKLRGVGEESEGELFLLLGRAYYLTGQAGLASTQLSVADRKLAPASPLRAEAALLLGQITQAGARTDEEVQQAKERFEHVIAHHPVSPAYLPALLGLAETESLLQEHDAALRHYAEVVEAVQTPAVEQGVKTSLRREQAAASLMQRHLDRTLDKDRANALRYAQLAQNVFEDKDVPAEIRLALARTHRAIADEALAGASAGRDPEFVMRDMDPVTRTEIKQHGLAAGDEYRRHAALVSESDSEAFASSIWMAGDSFDLAGDMDEARREFARYSESATEGDARRFEARFRLGQIYQAQQDFGTAAELYRDLRTLAAAGPAGSGVWADRAVVPLAKCLLEDGDASNDDQAEEYLRRVVEGSERLAPEAHEFREALVEIGRMYYTQGRFPDAVLRLSEAVTRYPEDQRLDELVFKLADSHRLEAGRIHEKLRQALPSAEADQLRTAEADHLWSAQKLFDRVRRSLDPDGQAGRRLSELEGMFLRNAYFYAGDCAFDLGNYQAAITAYDTARLRYADDPSSLVAMVQIVNAYVAQKQWAQARTANERARQHLSRFPDEVWTRPDLPMERKHWERWLDARTLLESDGGASPSANAGSGAGRESQP